MRHHDSTRVLRPYTVTTGNGETIEMLAPCMADVATRFNWAPYGGLVAVRGERNRVGRQL